MPTVWEPSPIDHVLRARDGRRAVGREERDEVSDLFGTAGATDRDAPERRHQCLARARAIASGGKRQAHC